jgi:hypothetical protein
MGRDTAPGHAASAPTPAAAQVPAPAASITAARSLTTCAACDEGASCPACAAGRAATGVGMLLRKPDPSSAEPAVHRPMIEDQASQRYLTRRLANRPAGEPVANSAHLPQTIGQPLDLSLRRSFEAHFQADLSDVSVHTSEAAAESAQSLDALAFASGRDIYFARGKYAPFTADGRHLLAHELAHVVQQGAGRQPSIAAQLSSGVSVGSPDDALEAEAEQSAIAFTNGVSAQEEPTGRAAATPPTQRVIQRQPASGGTTVDTSKADAIRKELDTFWPSNSKLEELWASLGVSLPEAINDKAYRDLWWRSVNDEKISLVAAARPLLRAFATDVVAVARARLSSQTTRLESLQAELKRAREQRASAAPPAQSSMGGVEDRKSQMSISAAPKPIADARSLVDSATVLHFLKNWDELLRSSAVGMRRGGEASGLLPTPGPRSTQAPFDPFPNSPPRQGAASAADRAPAPAPAVSVAPLYYSPDVSLDALLALSNVEYIDREAYRVLEKTHRQCSEQKGVFALLAQAMLAEDANLAVLDQKGLLTDVSALSRSTDAEASASITRVAKENADAAQRFLGMLDTVDWNALRPIHAYLLAGGSGGGRDWSNITAKGFVDAYFKGRAEAEQARAQADLIAQLALGAVTFVALLTPAAPLATFFLLATDAIAVGSAIVESGQAEKKADVLSAGADAGVVAKDEAARARKEAEEKHASMVMAILLTALPYMPRVAGAGAAAAGAIGRELTWAKLAEYSSRPMSGLAAGGDLILDLTKVGVSEFARSLVGGELSLNRIANRIPTRSRTLNWIAVTDAIEREGAEGLLHVGSEYGLKDYIRYHIHGPGTGVERFPIFLAPTKANQHANGVIEEFMRKQNKLGASVSFRATYVAYSGEELRPFIEGLLRAGDTNVIERLARDQGLLEMFLKEITYEIRVVPVSGGAPNRIRATISIGLPPGGAVASSPLMLIGGIPAP